MKWMIGIASFLLIGGGHFSEGHAFPAKSIKAIIGYEAGSSSDIAGRTFLQHVEKELGQTIMIINKPGAASALALRELLASKPDGHTLALSCSVNVLKIQGLLTQTHRDFDMLSVPSLTWSVLAVSAKTPFQTTKDLVDYAKAHPETVTIGGAHMGGAESINTYRLEKAADIKLKYVGFGGGGDALVALLGGHIDMGSGNPGELWELVTAKKVRVLGALTEKRLPFLPDVPTIKEQGINATGLGMNRGVVAPEGIPEEARKVLEEAFLKFSKTEEYKKFHKDNMMSEGYLNGNDFRKYLDGKNEAFSAILKEMGLLKPKK